MVLAVKRVTVVDQALLVIQVKVVNWALVVDQVLVATVATVVAVVSHYLFAFICTSQSIFNSKGRTIAGGSNFNDIRTYQLP